MYIFQMDLEKEKSITQKIKEGDDRTIIIEVIENGLPYELTGATLVLKGKTHNNSGITQTENITISKNVATIKMNRNFARVPGVCEVELLISKNGVNISTFTFNLHVKASVLTSANLNQTLVVDTIEVLENKILQATKVKEDTEQLIQSGGAATKVDIQKVNEQLDSKANLTNERVEVINDKTKTKGTVDFANFAGQGTQSNPIGIAVHNYTDGIPMQVDQVGENGLGILILKNGRNPLRRADKPSDYFGQDNYLNCRYQNAQKEEPVFIINKDGNLERWNGTLVIKGGINRQGETAVEIVDIYGARNILNVGVNGQQPVFVVNDTGISIKNMCLIKGDIIQFDGQTQKNILVTKTDDGNWAMNFNTQNKHASAFAFRNGGTAIATIGQNAGVDYFQAEKCLKYNSQSSAPSGLYGNTYYNQSTGYFYAYDKLGDSYRPFNEQYGNSAPTSGTWVRGDKIYNKSPNAGGYLGWVCVTAGTPGIWKGFGLIEA